MHKIGLWHITNGKPKKIKDSRVDLEQHLEDWIEADPALLQTGLTIIGRQVKVEAGYVDLLALDPQARWIVIEIKRGIMRRDTVAQVLDYASCIATMSADDLKEAIDKYLIPRGTSIRALLDERDASEGLEVDDREILLFVAGIGRAPGLERMTSFLSESYQMPLTLVSYDVFKLDDKQQILARELTEPEFHDVAPDKREMVSVDGVLKLADSEGLGEDFRKLYQAAERHGFYPRPYKTSIMYTPPANRTRMLFTVWAKSQPKGVKLYVGPKAFTEFYPVTEEEAEMTLGEDGWREMDSSKVDKFIEALDKLFSGINAND